MQEMPVLKIVVVSDPMDGLKAKLLSKFTNQTETGSFDFYSASHAIGKHIVKFNLWDIIGQEDETLSRTRQGGYKNAKAIALVFQYSSAESFQNIKERWCPEIKRCAPNIPVILLGVESDAPEQVTVSEARAFADEQALDVFIACRLDDLNSIKRVFDYVAVAGLAREEKPERRLLAAECYNYLNSVIRAEPKNRFIMSAYVFAKNLSEVLTLDALKLILFWTAIAEGCRRSDKNIRNTIELIIDNTLNNTWVKESKGITLFKQNYPPYRKAAQFEELNNKCTI